MSQPTAELVFVAITALMGIIWLLGIRFALSRLRPPRRDDGEGGRGAWGEEDAGTITGEVVIDGDPERLSRGIAERLASTGSLEMGTFTKITERTAERVAFERIPGSGRGVLIFDDGVMTLTREGDRVRVRYDVRIKRFSSTLRTATYLVCFVYGGLFVIGVPLAVWRFVLHHPDPNVRWQVLQTFQMVHGVWPPFLMGWLSSWRRKATGRYFDAILANLQHLA